MAVYTEGTLIWLPDVASGWVPGTVVSVLQPEDDGDTSSPVSIVVSHETDSPVTKTLIFPLSVIQAAESPAASIHIASSPPGQDVLPPLRNPPALETAEDLANLSNLNEPSVLHAIATRYMQHYPYTYSGIVLLSLNPFTPLNIYDAAFVKLYSGKKKGQCDPHVFAIAEEALDMMRRGVGGGGIDPTGAGDQTIIVSGESGAGKTVAAKYILRYFASARHPDHEIEDAVRTSDDESMSEVEKQILASNPIMEAFGNAKTTRNDNSSRFGKYIQILFDNRSEIVGARIRSYLLERSRLTYQPESERNYHIFYQLLAGAPSKERKDLSLSSDPSEFMYLAGGGPMSISIPGVDDAKEFSLTQASLSVVGISVERQWYIFKLLAALLHLGNIVIGQSRTDASMSDDDPALAFVSNLLGLSARDFKKWTIKKQLITRSEKIVSNLGSAQALVVRDSVAKYIYSCLFSWLVGVINESLAGYSEAVTRQAVKFIGVLDIYGFEHFTKNSYEQFCINWANEKLQQEFYAHVFKLEQEEYVREQIDWKFIEFADNQFCIDVIEGKLGILSILDEESRLPAGSDSTFATKLHQQVTQPWQQKVFKRPRFNRNAFTICHYAHDVTYDVDGFIEKNRDTVPDEHLHLLQDSSNSFLREVLEFNPTAQDTHKKAPSTFAQDVTAKRPSRKSTLGSIFKTSLISLMDTINKTNVHYIRCIKPNEAKKAWELEPQQVLGQLRACGVLETIRISCAGYPSRWEYAQFAERYLIMLRTLDWQKDMDLKELCSLILHKSVHDTDKYQLGLTKIFFRAGTLAVLESLRSKQQYELATTIQKYIRRRLAYKHYQELKRSTITIQIWWKGVMSRKILLDLKRERLSTRLQSAVRRWLMRQKFLRICATVVHIQAVVKGCSARRRAKEMKRYNAGVNLQSLLRGFSIRASYRAQIRKVILLQSLWRRILARQELNRRRSEAKSARKYKEISYHLENKVVELTQNLQRRIGEGKHLSTRVQSLDSEVIGLRHLNEKLEEKLAMGTIELARITALAEEKLKTEMELKEMVRKDDQQKREIQALRERLDTAVLSLQQEKVSFDQLTKQSLEDRTSIRQLLEEVESLREQASRNNTLNALTRADRLRDNPASPTRNHGLKQLEGLPGMAPNGDRTLMPRRRNRRHSLTGGTTQQSHMRQDGSPGPLKHGGNPRAVSAIYTPNTSLRPQHSEGLPLTPLALSKSSDEIIRLLEDESSLDDDVLQSLILQLKIPSPTLHTPPMAKEVLFPAHLISLISNEMWKQAMVMESERFLANVMQAVQQHVVSFKGEEIIAPGVFWLSNVQEILSFICVAEDDASKGYAPGSDLPDGRDLDWEAYTRLIGVVKNDLDSLEYNIYHSFMIELKKRLSKMVIPALIESQSLPGFITSDGSGRMFTKMLGGIGASQQPGATMDDILNLLNKTWKCLKSYYMEESVMHQVMTELLKLTGQISFNDLLMRRNFSSWKRAMQIQYNITRIEEWCKSHDMPEGLLQLEHLMQATKLLQLKKATLGDIDILFDVCWILSPTQVQKLISQYHTADYEAPLHPEILRAVAARVKPEDKSDQLLLTPETDEVGPYQLPPPREVAGLETYVPAWLNIPSVRRLAAYVA